MREIQKHNGIAAIHAEHDQIIEFLRSRYISQGHERELIYHAMSRPDFAEEMAINDAIIIGRETGAKIYIVHVSSLKGLQAIRKAKSEGMNIFAEVGLHYLFFTDEKLKGENGALFFTTPPLRKERDVFALWDGIADGTIDFIATDHNPYLKSEKCKDPRISPGTDGSEFAIPPGFTGIEEMVPLIFSEGVSKARISLEKMVQVLSSNPARILGLDKKGAVKVGNDADLVIIDPEKEKTISISNLHTKSDYTIYEGLKVKGCPIMTISRGEIIAKNGEFIGKVGRGKFIRRRLE